MYKSDFDNDGNDEYLMFAENPHSELGYPILCGNGKVDHLGIFNVVFIKMMMAVFRRSTVTYAHINML